MGFFGQSIKRREDPRLITGRGVFIDNLKLPGMVHATVLRSPHPHTRILHLDPATARESPGVIGVFAGADFERVQFTGTCWDRP